MMLVCCLAGSASADEPSGDGEQPTLAEPWRALAVGVMAAPKSWVAYSSTTFAPFGTLADDGLRLRMGSGYGKFTYTTRPPAETNCRYGNGSTAQIHGRVTFSDILAGYQISYGRLIVKAFAGAAVDAQLLTPIDTCNANFGRAIGFKGAIETWTDVTPHFWLSIDGNWTKAHGSYSTQARQGYRVLPALSVGFEEALVGNVAGHQLRAGLFARYDWSWGEAVVSGGLSGAHFSFQEVKRDNAWASVNVMVRY
jgi:Cellulose biosynthesis protein BcsS